MAWQRRADGPPRLRGRASQARRARILARDPVCRACLVRASVIADHIVNLAVSGKDDRLVTDDEMQGLCQDCSDAKTHTESMPARAQRPSERHPGEVGA